MLRPTRVGRGSRPRASDRDLGRTPARPAADLAACARPTLVIVLSRVHSWLDRHPAAGDAGVAVVLLLFCLSTFVGGERDAGAVDLVFTVLLCAPLAVRRRAPVATFAAVMVLCAAELLLVDSFLAANVAALVALYTLVVYAPRPLAAAACRVAARRHRPVRAALRRPLDIVGDARLGRADRASPLAGGAARRPDARGARAAGAPAAASRGARTDRARAARRRRALALRRDRAGRRRPLRRRARPAPPRPRRCARSRAAPATRRARCGARSVSSAGGGRAAAAAARRRGDRDARRAHARGRAAHPLRRARATRARSRPRPA